MSAEARVLVALLAVLFLVAVAVAALRWRQRRGDRKMEEMTASLRQSAGFPPEVTWWSTKL